MNEMKHNSLVAVVTFVLLCTKLGLDLKLYTSHDVHRLRYEYVLLLALLCHCCFVVSSIYCTLCT